MVVVGLEMRRGGEEFQGFRVMGERGERKKGLSSSCPIDPSDSGRAWLYIGFGLAAWKGCVREEEM